MHKVKLGIIGCGLAARELHLPALMKLRDKFEVTAVANHTAPKAREFSELLGGVPYFLNYRELLKQSSVEAVDIALPINLNYKVTRNSLEAGKHVFLEKPVAGTLIQARKMLEFPSRYNRVLMVAENFRYRRVYRKVKELVDSGQIGKPYSAIWNLYYSVPEDSKYAATEWRRKHKYPGGFINDAGVHNIAALRLLFGDFTAVQALTKSINPAIGTPDTMSMQFETAVGMIGVYNIFFTVNGHWEDKLLIFGDRGTIEVNTNKIALKRNEQDTIEFDESDDHGYYAELDEFYGAVTGGKQIFSNVDEGYRDLEAVLSALKSARTEKRIKILSTRLPG